MIAELARQKRKGLTVITNDTAFPGVGNGQLIAAKAVTRLIATHIGTNPETQRQYFAKEIEVELCPQGTLAERIRAGGYGLGGVLTPTGVGTLVAEGKQVIEVDGRSYLLERPIRADFALLSAFRADYYGNLEYELTARNFNPLMAFAAKTVMVEATEIVPVGMIPPDSAVTPSTLVTHIIARQNDHG